MAINFAVLFFFRLGIVFVVLKLFGIGAAASWSWLAVVAPLIVGVVLAAVTMFLAWLLGVLLSITFPKK